jgi:hypothetical protein
MGLFHATSQQVKGLTREKSAVLDSQSPFDHSNLIDKKEKVLPILPSPR